MLSALVIGPWQEHSMCLLSLQETKPVNSRGHNSSTFSFGATIVSTFKERLPSFFLVYIRYTAPTLQMGTLSLILFSLISLIFEQLELSVPPFLAPFSCPLLPI